MSEHPSEHAAKPRKPRSPRWALLGGATAVALVAMLGGVIVAVKTFAASAHGGPAPSIASKEPPKGSATPGAPGSAMGTMGTMGTSPSPSKAPAGAAAHGGTGAKLRQVDGGPGFYGKFSSPLPSNASFFPIAVWLESVTEQADVDRDRDVGLNTYLELTTNSTPSFVRDAGMYAIPTSRGGMGSETAGWFVSDEVDMWAGPGNSAWTGKYPGEGEICIPADARCGYTVQRTVRDSIPADGRMRFANYGKGVTFWETNAEASRFVNEFQHVVSADTYWFTDENICSQSEGGALFTPPRRLPPDVCHTAANYGRTIDRVRSLVSPSGSKPVWGFVEVGHPSGESTAPTITPQQISAAVWSTIIHGARGVIYFNHSFGGPCQTQHALRDPCYKDVRAAVKQLNGQIKVLAPVLNAPFADGVAKGSAGVDVSTKWYDGHFYVLAGSNRPSAQTAAFNLSCVGDASVTVLNEGRTVPMVKGAFSDRFADGNAVHIYRVDGGSSCGAY
jgi:hypothetical protein